MVQGQPSVAELCDPAAYCHAWGSVEAIADVARLFEQTDELTVLSIDVVCKAYSRGVASQRSAEFSILHVTGPEARAA